MSEARTVIAEAPLRGSAWHLLIRARYLSGDVDGALQSFRELSTMLDEELGIGPSAQTNALVRTVLQRRDTVAIP